MDLTPFDLTEVEQWMFWSARVDFVNLSVPLKSALRGEFRTLKDQINTSYTLSKKIYPNLADTQAKLDNILRIFNVEHLPSYIKGILAKSKVVGRVLTPHPLDLDIWVEYTGITQHEADRLPKSVQTALYSKYDHT